MRSTRAGAFVGAATVAVVAAALSPVTAQAAPSMPRTAGALSWGPCKDVGLLAAGAECATLKVPLDWDEPSNTTVSLALSRVRATRDRQGVMLSNPGGPGGSGLGMPGYLPGAVPRGVGLRYDWIGFDPRGVGSSRPALSCEPDYLKGPRPDYRPAERAPRAPNELAWIARTRKYAKTCGSRNGRLLEHVRTADTIRDIEAIRVALGEDRIGYYGFSYGTFIGQAYATMYPNRVRRMVLDGNLPPNYPGYGDGGRAQMASFQYVLGQFFGWIAQNAEVYGLGKTAGEVVAAYEKTHRELAVKPVGEFGSAELD
ncbi:MAG: alpha/beta fold hydrolase, partial [Gemmatimonadales bacterium]